MAKAIPRIMGISPAIASWIYMVSRAAPFTASSYAPSDSRRTATVSDRLLRGVPRIEEHLIQRVSALIIIGIRRVKIHAADIFRPGDQA